MTAHWLRRIGFSGIFGTFPLGCALGCVVAAAPGCGGGQADSATAGGTAETTDPTTDPTSSGGAPTSATVTEPADTSADSDGPPPWDPPTNFDVAGLPDAPEQACGGKGGGGGGNIELSYIWIANSSQGTISKIDTQTLVEEGRYRAKPANGDPSRTSVNLNGDVAVANRNGGVAKFYARAEDCDESNGTPGLQTSSGAADILAWGEEECLAWYLPLACNSNRPVAWTRGTFSEASCTFEDAKLWTVCDGQTLLLDGETGIVEETIVGNPNAFVYGGAADADGNFWGLDTSASTIYRVDADDLTVLSFALPNGGGYGITVDREGRPWVCGGGAASRFNLDDSTWTSTAGGGGGIGGCMTDGADTLWHSNMSTSMLLGFDIESLDVVAQVQLPEYVHGVSVDFEGYVWGVSFAGSNAYRADPESGEVLQYGGLTSAYTYSDMTGTGLFYAGGGGTPPG